MASDDDRADDLIPGKLKRLKSYHSDYGELSYGAIKKKAGAKPPDRKARQMKKLIERVAHLKDKQRRPKS